MKLSHTLFSIWTNSFEKLLLRIIFRVCGLSNIPINDQSMLTLVNILHFRQDKKFLVPSLIFPVFETIYFAISHRICNNLFHNCPIHNDNQLCSTERNFHRYLYLLQNIVAKYKSNKTVAISDCLDKKKIPFPENR